MCSTAVKDTTLEPPATSPKELLGVLKTWVQVCFSMGLSMQEVDQQVRLLAPQLIEDCIQGKFYPCELPAWLRNHGVSSVPEFP